MARAAWSCVNTDASCVAPLATLPALNIETTGDRSNGIFAQSVGGGGGNGGFAISGAVGVGGAASMSFGGKGGAGGSGGDVLVGASGQIITTGLQSDGIEATSVGGGGGNGGFAVAAAGSFGGAAALTFGGLGGAGNTGGDVTVDSATNISTSNDESRGLFVQIDRRRRRQWRLCCLRRGWPWRPERGHRRGRRTWVERRRRLGHFRRHDRHPRRPFGRHPGAEHRRRRRQRRLCGGGVRRRDRRRFAQLRRQGQHWRRRRRGDGRPPRVS